MAPKLNWLEMILEMQRLQPELCKKNQLPYLSPYNDEDVIAGEGTIGLEILKEQDQMDAVLSLWEEEALE